MLFRERSGARGHAWVGFVLALALLVGTIVVMNDLLLPKNSGATAAIWYISAGVLLLGMLFALRDAIWLGKEWRALDALDSGVRDPDAFFARVEAKFPGPSKRLVAERANAVRALRGNASHTAPNDYRTHYRQEAQASSSHIASATRFLSSALLLLAVIGTFAGMKAAIPELIDHIRAAGATGDSTSADNPVGTIAGAQADGPVAESSTEAADQGSTEVATQDPFLRIGEALSPVADAFGANFLALLGALALGVVSFAAMDERRRLLREIDRFSERTLYHFIPAGASADRLAQAVEQMRLNIDSVRGVSDGIRSLQGSLGTFERTLREAIEGLRSSFTQTVQQQSNEIQAQLNQTVGKVVVSMQDISVALGTTATAYEGLVTGLRERDLGVNRAATELERIGKRLDESMNRSSAALLAASADMKVTAETIGSQSGEAGESVSAAARTLEAAALSVSETLALHTGILERTPERLEGAIQTQGVGIAAAVKSHTARMDGTLAEVRATLDNAARTLNAISEWQATLRGEIASVANVIHEEAVLDRSSSSEHVTSQVDALRSEIEILRSQIEQRRRDNASVQGSTQDIARGTMALSSELAAIRELLTSVVREYQQHNGSRPPRAGDL